MEFFIFKTLQVLSRESAIAMVTKILFFARRRSRRAKKKIVVDVATRVAALARWRGDCQINELMRLLCSFAALHSSQWQCGRFVARFARANSKKTSKKFRRFLSYS